MITLKFKYAAENESDKQIISEYQKQYNNLLHLYYNRLKDGVSETTCKHLQYNNLDLMKSWFRQSCVKDASYLLKDREETVLFGGKYLFEQRFRHNILKECVYISFDEKILQEEIVKPISNRIFSIDMNPNYVGWSVLDWKSSDEFNIIDSGVISLKNINDIEQKYMKMKLPSTSKERKYLNNKRQNEILEVSKFLVDIAKHYRCECFGIEDLTIKSKDKGRGKDYNKLTNNNWNRNKLVNNLRKRCNIYGIKFVEVQPQYSSVIGNIVYRDLELPDMVLSSIEISRRCYEFNLQYIKKIKEKTKNVIFPNLTKSLLDKVKHSLEEVKCFVDFVDWKQITSEFKKSKIRYRFPLDERVFQSKTLRFVNVFL